MSVNNAPSSPRGGSVSPKRENTPPVVGVKRRASSLSPQGGQQNKKPKPEGSSLGDIPTPSQDFKTKNSALWASMGLCEQQQVTDILEGTVDGIRTLALKYPDEFIRQVKSFDFSAHRDVMNAKENVRDFINRSAAAFWQLSHEYKNSLMSLLTTTDKVQSQDADLPNFTKSPKVSVGPTQRNRLAKFIMREFPNGRLEPPKHFPQTIPHLTDLKVIFFHGVEASIQKVEDGTYFNLEHKDKWKILTHKKNMREV